MGIPTSRTYPRPVKADQVARDVEDIITLLNEGAGAVDVAVLRFFTGDLQPLSGSPHQSSIGGFGVAAAWGMVKASPSAVGFSAAFPSAWATYNIVALGAPRDGAGGNVALRAARVHGGVGDNLSTGTLVGDVVAVDMGATLGVLKSVTLGTGLAVPAGSFAHFQIGRRTADALDTYAGAFDLLGVFLTKGS